jgi:membrane protease YdiL (CAAX protease family)
MTRAASARSAEPPARPAARIVKGYFQRSELPLASLAFVLPLIVLYEVGTWYFTSDSLHRNEQRIIAFNLMQQFFHLFGVSGRYFPAMAVVGILLSWHIARGDNWQVDLRHLGGMLLESLLLAAPLIILGFTAAHYLPASDQPGNAMLAIHFPPTSMLVLSIGAGIYEELVFRLIACTVLSFLLLDLLELKKPVGYVLIVLISSLLFSLYHYLGSEVFQWRSFVFRTLAGIYFGVVFTFRGFGISAGTHAAYDILVLGLRGLG